MAMNFEELDETTRSHMRTEFEAELTSGTLTPAKSSPLRAGARFLTC